MSDENENENEARDTDPDELLPQEFPPYEFKESCPVCQSMAEPVPPGVKEQEAFFLAGITTGLSLTVAGAATVATSPLVCERHGQMLREVVYVAATPVR